MPIGRITGPMLVPNLERQGIDLAVEGNLIYWDVNRRLIGVNTSTPKYQLDVHGNVFAGDTLTVGKKFPVYTNVVVGGSTIPMVTGNVYTPLYTFPLNAAPNTGSIMISGNIGSLETFWSDVLRIDYIRRRVGVDTEPKYKLDIAGNVFAGNGLTIGRTNLSIAGESVFDPQYRLPTVRAANIGSIMTAAGPNSLETFWSNVLVIDHPNRLAGVDTVPKYKFDVAGNVFAGNGLTIGRSNTTITGTTFDPIYRLPNYAAVTTGSILSFGNVGSLDTFWSNLLTLDEQKRLVGVDTTPDTYKLKVAGNIFAGNGLTVGRKTMIGGQEVFQPIYTLPTYPAPNIGSLLAAGAVGTLDTFWSNLLTLDEIHRFVGVDKDPQYKLDVGGNLNVDTNVNIGVDLYVGNLITVSNHYSLPTTTPKRGDIIVALGGESSPTRWIPGPPEPNFARKRYCKVIDNLLGYGNVEFTMRLGQAAIVYNLSVSRPVKVEVFSTPDKDEINPYTFIATPDHLMDDGTVYLNDGSSFQSRQYSIFTNLETPPKDIHYVTITSIDNHLASTPVVFELLYYPPLLDSSYNTDKIVKMGTSLPGASVSADGDLFYNISTSQLYIYYAGAWASV
jgi:hypothetical protein